MASCASCKSCQCPSINIQDADIADQSDREDQDDHDKVQTHEDVVQPADRAVQIAHRVLNRELFAVQLPTTPMQSPSARRKHAQCARCGDAHARHLDLVAVHIAVHVLVEDRKRRIGLVPRPEEALNVLDAQVVRARPRERVEQPTRELRKPNKNILCQNPQQTPFYSKLSKVHAPAWTCSPTRERS